MFPHPIVCVLEFQLDRLILSFAPLSTAVPHNRTAFDSGECLEIRGIQRTNIPLSVITNSPRDIGTTFSLPRCCRSRQGCAYSLPFRYILFSPWSHESMKGSISQRYSSQRWPGQGLRRRCRSNHVRLCFVVFERISHPFRLETKDDSVSWQFREKDHDRTKSGRISHRFGGLCRSSDVRDYKG